jgi:hypothetical protein
MKSRIDMACETWDEYQMLLKNGTPAWYIFIPNQEVWIHSNGEVAIVFEVEKGRDSVFYTSNTPQQTAMALALWAVWPELGVDNDSN